MLAFVIAAFMLATFVLAAFMVTIAAGLFTSLHLAAVLGTFVDTGLAVVGSAGGVFASTLVMALMLTDLSVSDIGVNGLFSSVVVVASGHAESESGSDKSG